MIKIKIKIKEKENTMMTTIKKKKEERGKGEYNEEETLQQDWKSHFSPVVRTCLQ